MGGNPVKSASVVWWNSCTTPIFGYAFNQLHWTSQLNCILACLTIAILSSLDICGVELACRYTFRMQLCSVEQVGTCILYVKDACGVGLYYFTNRPEW